MSEEYLSPVKGILLGFEVAVYDDEGRLKNRETVGKAFYLNLHHLVITGMTELSGKTTAIEALIERSGLRALVFKTKRGEKGFERVGRLLPLYFKERSDWQYVSSLIEATLREKMKFERSWIIRACKGAKTLRDVYARVKEFLKKERLRALDRSIFTNLQAYLDLVLPSIERLKFTDKLEIGPGVNVMDLEDLYAKPEVQALIIRSVMEYILEYERDVIIVVPECWKFLPQARGSPVKIFFERFIREGATINNYLWLDSQDIAGVDKTPLRQVDNWILGRQKETHEVDRTIDALPLPKAEKPKPVQIRRLKVGHFIAACGDQVKLIYVLPAGVPEGIGRSVARGELTPEYVRDHYLIPRLEEVVDLERLKKVERNQNELTKTVDEFIRVVRDHIEDPIQHAKDLPPKIKEISEGMEKLHKKVDTLSELEKVRAKLSPGETGEIEVNAEQAKLIVAKETKTLQLKQSDLMGRIAIVYAEGLLPEGWFSSGKLNRIMEQRFGAKEFPGNFRKILPQLVYYGFFEKKLSGRRPDYRVKLATEIAKKKGLLEVS